MSQPRERTYVAVPKTFLSYGAGALAGAVMTVGICLSVFLDPQWLILVLLDAIAFGVGAGAAWVAGEQRGEQS